MGGIICIAQTVAIDIGVRTVVLKGCILEKLDCSVPRPAQALRSGCKWSKFYKTILSQPIVAILYTGIYIT